ncbi:NAD(P)/FAD-dependent oxidoreductase [Methylobacterium sp. J-077]|uniref:NAD(P)/FAD-dependent oxidoreductase n=1 Tax=Methylobacterium sp. J-077 TaxID=2836656 RepID=UPI001FBBFD45|nr:FAD-binding oxidoreductase [Methylobacterium sp. J-077]MCJ2127182.1 FAD-dependent oxidoreductase [Methylobacterium sp. J-077]
MPKDVIVLGAGIVGLSTALHLQRRGRDVIVVDRRGPGGGASFGNGGLIQREAVFPYRFPRAVGELLRIARNRSIDAVYHPFALPGLASPLLRYWWHAHPDRYAHAAQVQARMIMTCLDEHLDLAREADATELLRPLGWMRLYRRAADLDAALLQAEVAHREYGVNYAALDGDGLEQAEPHLLERRAGALHWTDALSLSDPHALTVAYAKRLESLGGAVRTGDADKLEKRGASWWMPTDAGPIEASAVVVALGAASTRVTRRFGYAPPLFGKRGYHMHYAMQGNAVLNHPVLDSDKGFLMSPMRRGVRLSTGAEFARDGAAPTPVQLARAEPIARALLPLGDRVDPEPWLGERPCMPDMVPVIGPAPRAKDLWCAFGHAHQGMTHGPSSGRMLAELMTGDKPFLDPYPYRPDRF